MDPVLAYVVKLVIISQVIIGVSNANFVFNAKSKFGRRLTAPGRSILKTLKAHDAQRHGRMLAAIDFQLGGNGLNTGTGNFHTKLSIGTPPKDYFVSVDTGSNDLWINCAECVSCPEKSDLGINITKYDLKSSSTGKTVSCDEKFCSDTDEHKNYECKTGGQCKFSVQYGDFTKRTGYFVRDNFKFDKISGDFRTASMDGGSIAFGCSTKGRSSSSARADDGILGLGQGSTSILNQLASSGKSKRIFSHCLDSFQGGGIFAIGEVVEPKLQTTPIAPGKTHYNAYLDSVKVGGFEVWNYQNKAPKAGMGNLKPEHPGAIIDSGTTLTYFPNEMYDSIMSKIIEKHPGVKTYIVHNEYTCFKYSNKNIDDNFPVVSLHFENSATLNTYPHDYLFRTEGNELCFAFIKSPPQLALNGEPITLLGNVVLADKLIVYDLEKMEFGFTEYNCSSSIKVKDESSGNLYSVLAHDISVTSSQYYNTNPL